MSTGIISFWQDTDGEVDFGEGKKNIFALPETDDSDSETTRKYRWQ